MYQHSFILLIKTPIIYTTLPTLQKLDRSSSIQPCPQSPPPDPWQELETRPPTTEAYMITDIIPEGSLLKLYYKGAQNPILNTKAPPSIWEP